MAFLLVCGKLWVTSFWPPCYRQKGSSCSDYPSLACRCLMAASVTFLLWSSIVTKRNVWRMNLFFALIPQEPSWWEAWQQVKGVGHSRKLRAHNLDHKHEAEEVNRVRGETINTQGLSPVTSILTLNLHKRCNQLKTNCSNTWAYGGHSYSDITSTMHIGTALIGLIVLDIFSQVQVLILLQIVFCLILVILSFWNLDAKG